MLGLAMAAATLGIIIAIMEEGEFPGWLAMVVCVLSAVFPAAIVNGFLPPGFFIVGLTVGAIFAGFMISYMCGMSVKRASIAAGIYLAIQTVFSITLSYML